LDRFKAMSAFAAVVEANGFASAARRLGIPLATVSRRVSELEDHLEARLLVRTTRRVSLTDGGRAYFEVCRRVLDEVGEAERAAKGEFTAPKGNLTIAAPLVLGRLHVVPLVAEFLRDHSEVSIRLLLGDGLANLVKEGVDAAVRIGASVERSLVATRLGSVRRIVCASPGYIERHGAPKHPKELASRDCIAFSGLDARETWPFRIGRKTVRFPVHSRLVVTTAEAAIDAAAGGAGLTAVLSYQVAEHVAAGRLAIVLRSFETQDRPVNFLRPGGRLVPAKLRAFADFAVPRLRARFAELAV
jgi:DNA-binding transcriptional LysR family regulator